MNNIQRAAWAREYRKKNLDKVKAVEAANRDRNRERRQQQQKALYHSNPQLTLWKNAKARASKKDIPFTITVEDIAIPDVCPVFKTPFKRGTRADKDYSPSLDRIDSTQGYIPGNVQVISFKANKHKGTLTPTEIKQLAEYILG